MSSDMFVCFDLEGTIIKSWTNHSLLVRNIDLIKSHLDKLTNAEFHIFSFAIYDDGDKDQFDVELKSKIEELFGISISKVWTMDGMAKTMNLAKRQEVFDMGKQKAHYALYHQTPSILFDDVVNNERQGNCNYIKCDNKLNYGEAH
jgi:hypothetical protein